MVVHCSTQHITTQHIDYGIGMVFWLAKKWQELCKHFIKQSGIQHITSHAPRVSLIRTIQTFLSVKNVIHFESRNNREHTVHACTALKKTLYRSSFCFLEERKYLDISVSVKSYRMLNMCFFVVFMLKVSLKNLWFFTSTLPNKNH